MNALQLISILVATSSCAQQTLPVQIYNTEFWHAYEEDKGSLLVYRFSSFQFPPSRGRDGFVIKRNHVFKQISIGASDNRNIAIGKWRELGPDMLLVSFEGAERKSITMRIIQADKEKILCEIETNELK